VGVVSLRDLIKKTGGAEVAALEERP